MNQQIKLFSIPNLLTAGNLVCGSLCIIYAFAGRLDVAPFFILGAALFDFFDGFAARLLKIQSEIGKQLDSLADMVSFGLAPGLLMMVVLSTQTMENEWLNLESAQQSWDIWFNKVFVDPSTVMDMIDYLPFVALFIPVFSMLRLAKFNIDERQTSSFIGLPTPGNALFLMTYPLVLAFQNIGGADDQIEDLFFNPSIIVALIIVFSFLLVSELPLFSLKIKNLKWKGNEGPFILVLSSAILIPIFQVWSIALIVFLYLILSIIIYQKSKNKRNEV